MLNKKSLLLEDLDTEHVNEIKFETKEGHVLLAPMNIIKKELLELLAHLGIEEGDINVRINEYVQFTDGIFSSMRAQVKAPQEVITLKERMSSKTYDYYLKLFTKETVH